MSVCSSYYVCWQYVCTLYPALFESVMVPKSSDNPVPVLCCFPTLQCSLVFTFYVCVCVCVCVVYSLLLSVKFANRSLGAISFYSDA